ncbi:MAG: 16S rRNA (guanine(527)-N(7))-methyltransferase RsmG [Roseiflexaceae bacterium]
MSTVVDLLTATTQHWGLALTATQVEQFDTYRQELQQWNTQLNLTTVIDDQGIVVRHFLDSLSCALYWGPTPPTTLADIGSGAGFPGLALAILAPHTHVTLVESIEKKAAFLRHMIERLQLAHVRVVVARAEEIGRDPQHREQYQVVTARALAELRILVEYCLPLCLVGGVLIAPKGPQAAAEAQAATNALSHTGGQLAQIHAVHLPGEPERAMVVISKTQPTPLRYPRAIGIPSKRPL